MGKKFTKAARNIEYRESVFHPEFREDLTYWVKTDRRTALRILKLIEAVMRDPFRGIGKPEPLKFLQAGTWSRRITQEHRLVYVVSCYLRLKMDPPSTFFGPMPKLLIFKNS